MGEIYDFNDIDDEIRPFSRINYFSKEQKMTKVDAILQRYIGDLLFLQYRNKRVIMNIHMKITSAQEAFNQELFAKLHPLCKFTLKDILKMNIGTIK